MVARGAGQCHLRQLPPPRDPWPCNHCPVATSSSFFFVSLPELSHRAHVTKGSGDSWGSLRELWVLGTGRGQPFPRDVPPGRRGVRRVGRLTAQDLVSQQPKIPLPALQQHLFHVREMPGLSLALDFFY